jgi:hypothetical protein
MYCVAIAVHSVRHSLIGVYTQNNAKKGAQNSLAYDGREYQVFLQRKDSKENEGNSHLHANDHGSMSPRGSASSRG